ncbi:hypothetical protein SprV_0200900700 [Sparganum proliferum]
MEALVKSAIQQYCEENNLLQDSQHGFRRERSCLSNLLACLEIWTRALEEGFEVDVVYIDFRKAFDTVPHQRLLRKLNAIGIRGDLLNWIGAFLIGRKQRVCIGDDMSEWSSLQGCEVWRNGAAPFTAKVSSSLPTRQDKIGFYHGEKDKGKTLQEFSIKHGDRVTVVVKPRHQIPVDFETVLNSYLLKSYERTAAQAIASKFMQLLIKKLDSLSLDDIDRLAVVFSQ